MLHPKLWSYVRRYGRPYEWLFPQLTWRRSVTDRRVFLTFDDGPLAGGTDVVLDLLAESGTPATFFWVGDNVRRHPRLVERALREGHRLGNHGLVHESGWRTSTRTFVEQAQAAQVFLPRGEGRPLFRPPFGKLTRAQRRALEPSFELVMWDLMSGDFSSRTRPEAVERFFARHLRPGSILLFHDSAACISLNRALLPRIISISRALGFEFDVL